MVRHQVLGAAGQQEAALARLGIGHAAQHAQQLEAGLVHRRQAGQARIGAVVGQLAQGNHQAGYQHSQRECQLLIA
jgi:hypothetical protein